MEEENNALEPENQDNDKVTVTHVSGMYEDYFLDYASYVILERAVPALDDGLKPVQRRIMHAMREMEDGRYHKVANVIGQTMRFHPHGDASIGDALVALGQKDLMIDTQGNWGNILTGDRAAAPRYIESRLTKFALEVGFSPKVTEWQASYDGRAKEPVHLPVKFPLLLAQGVEGIAVGLSTRLLPHNFNELIDASIKILRGRSFTLLPDFPTGGIADFSQYNEGVRGSRVRVRAKISMEDKKTLVITQVPFGTTTTSLIDSVIKANDKGKIKIKKIEDNTAENVEILVHLVPGVSPDKMIDALYAFTDCEVSIAPLSCVIYDDKPLFVGVKEILKRSTDRTLDLLRQELEIQLRELEEQWHFASLERIFIEEKIYRDIEEAETWEEVIGNIREGLTPHIKHLIREVTDDDITRLTEIRIKRISKFDKDKADQHILDLEGRIEAVKHNLANLVDFAVEYFKNIKKKYGEGRERKTEIKLFEDIDATKVAIANTKLYVNREEGFIGTSLKKDEFVTDCSDIDDIIVFLKNGKMMVTKVDQKTYIGKNIIHVAVWKKGDKRTVYNMIYRDGAKGASYMKRFNVTSITRDKEYDLSQGKPATEVLYFTANPNGEAEQVTVFLRNLQGLRKLKIEIDFAELAIKGRVSKGNRVTKYPVKKIELSEEGVSTLAARKIWFDDSVQRLNADERGELLGSFKGQDQILEVTQTGHYRLLGFDLSTHFEEDMIIIEKFNPKKPLTAIYFDGEKERFYVKRFIPEASAKKELFISESDGSYLEAVFSDWYPRVELVFKKIKGKQKENEEIVLSDFISVKGMKAQGNQLTRDEVKDILRLEPLPLVQEAEKEEEAGEDSSEDQESSIDNSGQPTLF
ncbi:DNA gyrase/topoisomerase IV subunit A [Owenweeksia hongkongensis]|uniref:Type IIA topoisomerase (DNA gyrase/topo II, topoisomerase IV), A subunit n=1 Tax=Owenweeksia hongkongensis (strain DSM 17368 / CIP 108786 / JCM 12287 / NRRL B-23963 / UST20020801) TaxID=926562 RepID=G8R504_OWEHD|nr:DNA gyrase/topoisomerase IV subunit A [Owenweeksia hongkongensis]AEV34318.1 type IIA topoisomerase (DNA gyrase/topo II, topoisomerase IV), A subunit [Owenweeksia hongkongensis DSM 17368]